MCSSTTAVVAARSLALMCTLISSTSAAAQEVCRPLSTGASRDVLIEQLRRAGVRQPYIEEAICGKVRPGTPAAALRVVRGTPDSMERWMPERPQASRWWYSNDPVFLDADTVVISTRGTRSIAGMEIDFEDLVRGDQRRRERLAAATAAKRYVARCLATNAKYGSYAGSICEQRVGLGMTAPMVRAAWGKPNRVNETMNEGGRFEQWVYGSSYVYFANGRVRSIQTSR